MLSLPAPREDRGARGGAWRLRSLWDRVGPGPLGTGDRAVPRGPPCAVVSIRTLARIAHHLYQTPLPPLPFPRRSAPPPPVPTSPPTTATPPRPPPPGGRRARVETPRRR